MVLHRLYICLIFISFFLSYKNITAGELILTGVYLGKNLYVQNSESSNNKKFCTEKVYLNGRLVLQNPSASTFMIDLSRFKVNDPVKISIVYQGHCVPIIINPQVIKAKNPFKFQEVYVDEKRLSWSTIGEQKKMRYFIEKRIHNKWIIIQSMEAIGEDNKFSYAVTLTHEAGLNQYRIKGILAGGGTFYSAIVEYESGDNPVSFYPARVTNKITFSKEARYEVLDLKGNIIAKGNEKEIIVENLTPGLYYLVLDNRIEKFIKK